MFGRLEEALNSLKSSLIFTPSPIIFHIFTEDHLREEFKQKVRDQFDCFFVYFLNFKRLIWNGRLNINRNFKLNFIQLNLHVEMMNDGEHYLNHVVLNVYLFQLVEHLNERKTTLKLIFRIF
jgi:hypothetical protein